MKKKDIRYWLLFFAVFVAIWIGLDFVFSAMRAAVFVFARAFKTALYSFVITVLVFYLLDRFFKERR